MMEEKITELKEDIEHFETFQFNMLAEKFKRDLHIIEELKNELNSLKQQLEVKQNA